MAWQHPWNRNFTLQVSEENAYGAIYELWFNIVVEGYTLKRQTTLYVNVLIKERQNLRDRCQDQSYYECLASKFTNDYSCKG